MARYINIIWLSICILVGGSVAALSSLLFVAAIGSGISQGFNHTDVFAIPLLLVPLGLTIWSFLLCRGVYRSGAKLFHRFRLELLAFYGITAIVSVWTSTWTATRDGYTRSMFSPETAILVGSFFLVPILSLVLIKLGTTEQADGK